jgi:hypothetical protein
VLDEDSKSPILDYSVNLFDPSESVIFYSKNQPYNNGYFDLNYLPNNQYKLRVSSFGYEDFNVSFNPDSLNENQGILVYLKKLKQY